MTGCGKFHIPKIVIVSPNSPLFFLQRDLATPHKEVLG